MALVDPNIAMGYRGIEVPNQLAQYGQLAQIQNAQNQNQLAQYQLSSAQRADEQQNNLYAAAKQPGFALDFASALKYGAPGLAAFKAQQEAAASKLTQTKTQGEIDAQGIAAAQKRVDAFSTALAPLVSAVQSNKPITHDDVFGQATRLVAQGLLRQEDLASIPMKAEQLPSFVMNMASSTENSRKALETYLPKALVAGGSVINQNPLAAGGIGNKLADVTMTPFEQARVPILQQQANTSAGQLEVARGNLKVAQDRLAKDGAALDPSENAAISKAIIEGRLDPNRVNGRNAKILATTLLANPDANVLELGVSAGGAMAAERSLATQTAKMSTAANEAGKMIKVVEGLSDKVNRTEFPTINAISNAVSKGTGGTEIVKLNTSINALVNSYARAISPTGQPTVSDKNHARDIINSAYSTGQLSAILGVMQEEMDIARQAAGTASTELKEMRETAKGRGEPPAASNVVVTPDGQSHTFPTPAAAAQFKKAAGL